MMNRWLEAGLGLNVAAIVRGFRLGPREFYRGCRQAFTAALPDQHSNSSIASVLPVQSLEDILGEQAAEIKLRIVRYEDGMQPLADALALLSLLVVAKPQVILEIGTYMGHTTRAMAENATDAIIHTIDLPDDYTAGPSSIPKDDFHLIEKRVVGREFRDKVFRDRIVQHFGDTASLDFATVGRASFFFIDGSHTYEYCRNDSEKCLTIADRNATFIWHDCDERHPGVVRFLGEWRASGKDIVRIEGTSLAYWKSDVREEHSLRG